VSRRLYLLALIGLALVSPRAAAEPAPDHCGLEDPEVARQAGPVPVKAGETPGLGALGLPVVRRVRVAPYSFGVVGHGAAGGALAGKTVYVSPGHGWTWRDNGLGWRTQRPNTFDLVEDFISVETAAQYLVPMLRNMGAYVVPVRETDLNSGLAVVDDGGGDGDMTVEGTIELTEGPAGYGIVATPIVDQANPFASGTSKELATAPSETGRVVWTFDVPADGAYNVYAGWVQNLTRASDAHYIVRHAGGETHFRVDQRRHGGTWVLLGRFYFRAGRAADIGSLVLANDSADTGATLSADVARIGGGVGVIDRGGGANGRPMFESCARYYAQLAGAPTSVWDYSSDDGSDDVGTRSRFAAWEHEDGEDAVYIAWHTNAASGPARGTSSFVYGPSSYGPISEFTGTPGSIELVTAVHQEMVSDFRAVWQSDWEDRGLHSAYFGEVNPNHNPEMPAALFEIAFHSTAEDADALRDPRFRYLAARAIAQGVAKYFAQSDGVTIELPPEPPVAVVMKSAPDDTISISWRAGTPDAAAGDPATGYRVYLSSDGLAFDEGTPVTGESLTIDAPEDGAAVYARVTATNAGGESFPSRVVGARPAPSGQSQVLVVGGFDRIDGAMLIRDDLSDYALATIERAFIARINDQSHLARYGAAIDAAQVSFDAVTADAVSRGDVALGDYGAVIWQLGEQSRASGPLNAAERGALATYVGGGGKLVVTGSEAIWALDEQGSPEEQSFVRDVLHVTYVGDDAETYAFTGVEGPFAGMAAMTFDDKGEGSYDADYPDVIAPGPGASSVLGYDGGTGGSAGVWFGDETTAAQTLVLGFPFETISGAADRAEVMARIFEGFGIEPDSLGGDPDDDGALEGGCFCRGGSPSGGSAALLLLALVLVCRRRRA
jgi:N-acetylmuramoyl-L-alanine amidase